MRPGLGTGSKGGDQRRAGGFMGGWAGNRRELASWRWALLGQLLHRPQCRYEKGALDAPKARPWAGGPEIGVAWPRSGASRETGGGGGFGHPLDREAELVLADVRAGFVGAASAERDYGVVLTAHQIVSKAVGAPLPSRIRDRRVQIRPRDRPAGPVVRSGESLRVRARTRHPDGKCYKSRPLSIGAQAARHAPDRLGDDGNGYRSATPESEERYAPVVTFGSMPIDGGANDQLIHVIGHRR